MSKHRTDAGEAIVDAIHNSLCRRIRIAKERIHLARILEMVARSRSDVLVATPRGLDDIMSYRRLADEGLSHATFRRTQGSVIVLAATNRVWRKPELRRRLLEVKRDARRIGRRVVLVTKRGIARYSRRDPCHADRTAAKPAARICEGVRPDSGRPSRSRDLPPNG
jgi:hypothetical protein